VFVKSPSDLNVLPDGFLSLDARVTEDPGTSTRYRWKFKGVQIPGATRNVLNIPNVKKEHVGKYVCIVESLFGNQTTTVESKEVDVQIHARNNNTDSQVLAQDDLSIAQQY